MKRKPLLLHLMLLLLQAILMALSSCSGLDGYSRTYTVNVTDEHGRKAGVGVTLQPIVRNSGK